MLFLKANGQDPVRMGFRKDDVSAFPERLASTKLRLDPDELEHAKSLAGLGGETRPHAEGLHIHGNSDPEMIPDNFRSGVMRITGTHSGGRWVLKNGEWTSQSL
jgi:hypothetical protein